MTRRRWLAGALTIVVVTAASVLVARRSPARVAVDVGVVTRQARFVSTASASGEIVATRYADIGSSAMGKIVELPVSEGERVAAGQLLARIDPVRAESDVAGAAAQVAALEAEQRAAAEQIRAATADLTAADARARDAGQQLARCRQLSEAGLLPASELETARAAADAAAAQVGSLRAGLDRARQAADAASRRVAQARAQTVSASDTLAKTAIVSPIDRRGHAAAGPRRRDGGRRHPEPAGHDADDHLRSERHQRRSQGCRGRRPPAGGRPARIGHAGGAAGATVSRARSSRSARARCPPSAPAPRHGSSRWPSASISRRPACGPG